MGTIFIPYGEDFNNINGDAYFGTPADIDYLKRYNMSEGTLTKYNLTSGHDHYVRGGRSEGRTYNFSLNEPLAVKSVAKAAAKVTKGGLNLVWIGLLAVAAYFIFKKKKKGGKGKK